MTALSEAIDSASMLAPGQTVSEHFRTLIDALPAAIYTTDAQGRITHFNPACVTLSGRTPEIGSDHWCVTWKLFHADGTPMAHDQCPMAIALREGRAVRGVEAIAERPDGSRIWFEPYPTPIFDEAGTLVGGINMLVDITQRKQAELERLLLAERMRLVTDAAPSLISYVDNEYRYRLNNKAYEEWFGHTREELNGKHLRDVIGEAAFQKLRPRLEAAFAGTHVQFEDEIPYKGGTRVIHADYVPDIKPDGEVAGMFAIIADISERRKAEAASASLAAIVESSDDAIISKDLNGIITSWNKSAERMFGYTAEEAVGRSITMLMPADRHGEEPKILARLRSGERVENFDTIRIHRDGTPLNISLTISPVRDTAGRIVGASKIARDITQRIRVEEALRASEERAHDMAERQQLLAAELAHRVKNTLATVQGIASQTLRSTGGKEAFEKAFLGRISLLAHAQDLLTQSQWKGAYLDRIVRTAITPHAPLGEGVGGGVTIEGPAINLPPKQVVAMSMILHELATNAVKYGALSREGGRLDVRWRIDDSSVVITWRETGGPPVERPARTGFGSKLIERLASFELEGEAQLDYQPAGLTARITIPLAANS